MNRSCKIKFYAFSGKDENGKKIRGTIDAPNKSIAHYKLMTIGILYINYVYPAFFSLKRIFKLNIKEKTHLFFHLDFLINSGITIIDSLNIIKLDSISFKIKYLLHCILINLKTGYRLSEAMEKLPYPAFSPSEIMLIKIAETTGTLDVTLKFIHDKLKSKLFLRKNIFSSLLHPLITGVISFIIIYAIFKWIIPQFSYLFYQKNHDLPKVTKFIFSISKHINFIIGTIMLSLIFFSVIIRLMIKKNLFSNRLKEKIFLIIPIIGKLLIISNRIDFCYTLSISLKAGIPIHEALKETSNNITLPYLKERFRQATIEIISGRSLSATLRKYQFLPHSAIQTIFIAENTGNLDHAFKIISQQLIYELSTLLSRFEKIIEPVIIISLGAIIGIVLVAIYLPIFQLGSLY